MLIILLQFKVNIHSFQDIPIAIPAPINTIPDQILPSHIVVPRCSGEMNFLLETNLGHSLTNYLLAPAAKFVSKLECSHAKSQQLYLCKTILHTLSMSYYQPKRFKSLNASAAWSNFSTIYSKLQGEFCVIKIIQRIIISDPRLGRKGNYSLKDLHLML